MFEKIIKRMTEKIYIDIENRLEKSVIKKMDIEIDFSALKKELYDDMMDIFLPILVQDINEWSKKQDIQELNPKEKYNRYCHEFFSCRYSIIYNTYKFLSGFYETYKSNLFNSLERFCIDLDSKFYELIELFCYDKGNKENIKFIRFVGDKHYNGRNILFTIGLEKYYYKKNGMYNYELSCKLKNILFKEEYFKFPKTILGNGFMFQEEVKHEGCLDIKQIEEFYYNIGILLSFIYLLNGTDMHNENIIADRNYPYVIDLETVINPIIKDFDCCMQTSVFASGMLPMKFSRCGNGMMDSSAIGQQNIINKMERYLIDENTSRVRLKYRKIRVDDELYFLPHIEGRYYDACNYRDTIVQGFEYGYKRILEYGEAVLEEIDRIKKVRCRFLLRNTYVYSTLVRRILSPDMMKSKDNIDLLLYKLFSTIRYIKEEKKKHYIDIEIEQLKQGFIPYFEVESDSRVSIDAKDMENLLTVKESLCWKLKKMCKKDLEFQIEMIKISLNVNDFNYTIFSEKQTDLQLNKVISESIYQDSQNTFVMTMQKDWQGNYIFSKAKNGVYEGILGLLIADDGLENYFSVPETIKSIYDTNDIGMINGYSSVLMYFLYKEKYEPLLYFDLKQKIRQYDVIDGYMGYVILMYNYLLKLESENEQKKCRAQIINIIKNVDSSECITCDNLGFAHGISGVKIFMYIAYRLTGEISYFNNYLELEEKDQADKYVSCAWCNGLTGFISSLYVLYRISGEEQYINKLREGLDRLFLLVEEQKEYCLCHGMLGVLDMLLTLSDAGILNSQYNKKYKLLERKFMSHISTEKILKKDISLFTGLSGIRYYFSRKENRKKSILTLCY